MYIYIKIFYVTNSKGFAVWQNRLLKAILWSSHPNDSLRCSDQHCLCLLGNVYVYGSFRLEKFTSTHAFSAFISLIYLILKHIEYVISNAITVCYYIVCTFFCPSLGCKSSFLSSRFFLYILVFIFPLLCCYVMCCFLCSVLFCFLFVFVSVCVYNNTKHILFVLFQVN